ncbi:MAG: recombinase RecA [Gemmatimonadetes bacterium]|nr:recombinase RecA [Gemmatimonadota bacterium]MDE2734989.1 recombinase RecA [Gemmatimonadota bacterium]
MAKANGHSADGNKARALELAMSQIEKQYGKGSIMRLGDEGGVQEVEAISTGSLAVDAALGIGGLPKGRIVEISGPEGAGKTMLSLHAIRESQKRGGTAAFIDAEHALDVSFARRIGVDVENLIISQPDSGEQALEIVDTLVRSGAFDIIVVDSVAALVPQAELEGDMGDSHMGLHARLMSQALRKLAGSINRSKTCLIFLNQLRMKIGVMFGNPETTTGGRALPFYSSVRIDIRRIARVKDGDLDIGNRTRVKVVKNKVAPPFREAEFDLIFHGDSIGISWEGDLVDIGVDKGLVDKSGAWFSYNGERLGQGRDNAKEFLREHPEIAAEIEHKLRGELGLEAVVGQDEASQAGE